MMVRSLSDQVSICVQMLDKYHLQEGQEIQEYEKWKQMNI
jgi:hypothetical protein